MGRFRVWALQLVLRAFRVQVVGSGVTVACFHLAFGACRVRSSRVWIRGWGSWVSMRHSLRRYLTKSTVRTTGCTCGSMSVGEQVRFSVLSAGTVSSRFTCETQRLADPGPDFFITMWVPCLKAPFNNLKPLHCRP